MYLLRLLRDGLLVLSLRILWAILLQMMLAAMLLTLQHLVHPSLVIHRNNLKINQQMTTDSLVLIQTRERYNIETHLLWK